MFRPASVRHPQHRVALSLGQSDGVAADRGDTHALHRIAGADALDGPVGQPQQGVTALSRTRKHRAARRRCATARFFPTRRGWWTGRGPGPPGRVWRPERHARPPRARGFATATGTAAGVATALAGGTALAARTAARTAIGFGAGGAIAASLRGSGGAAAIIAAVASGGDATSSASAVSSAARTVSAMSSAGIVAVRGFGRVDDTVCDAGSAISAAAGATDALWLPRADARRRLGGQ